MSFLNLSTIFQRVYDSTTNSLKMTSSDMSIELSADDGDSVVPQKKTLQIAVTAGQIVDVSKYSQITYLHPSNPHSDLKIMMLDGITEISAPNLTTGHTFNICAASIKIVSAGEIVLKS